MKRFPIRLTIFLFALLLSLGLANAQVATYTELNVPSPLVLKPGVTQIAGGITVANQLDRFTFSPTVGGTLIVRLRYQHRTGSIFPAITELPHLGGSLVSGTLLGANFTASGSPVTLSSPFFLQNSTNAISVTQNPGDNTSSNGFQLTISAPVGKTHPDYLVELDYQPGEDAFEGTSGNNSLANATSADANVFGNINGSIQSSADTDWFRFNVPAGRTLRVYFSDRYLATPALPLHFAILNAQGIPLQTSDQLTSVTLAETADANGDTFYVRISAQDAYAEGWNIRWLLEDSLDPNESLAQARHLGTLAVGGRIDHANLTASLFAVDYYTFDVNLSPGNRILIATLPDPATSQTGGPSPLMVVTGGYSTEDYGNYVELYGTGSGPISFLVNSVNPTRYRLLIKPFSAYDDWQLFESSFRFTPPLYYLPGDSDFDRDGVPASLEFALRRSPFTATTSAISAPYLDGSLWKVNVAMPAGGSRAPIQIKESTDLIQWTDLPAGRGNFGGASIPQGRTSGAVITLSRPGEPKNFLRFGAPD